MFSGPEAHHKGRPTSLQLLRWLTGWLRCLYAVVGPSARVRYRSNRRILPVISGAEGVPLRRPCHYILASDTFGADDPVGGSALRDRLGVLLKLLGHGRSDEHTSGLMAAVRT